MCAYREAAAMTDGGETIGQRRTVSCSSWSDEWPKVQSWEDFKEDL